MLSHHMLCAVCLLVVGARPAAAFSTAAKSTRPQAGKQQPDSEAKQEKTTGAAKRAATAKEFVSMFDGKSLSGWSVSPKSARGAWKVRDGVIVANGDAGRSYLVWQKNQQIADFELRLQYRFPKGHGNSGVSIRAVKDETGKRDFKSYHADFGHVGIGRNILGAWDFHTPGRREHGCARGSRLIIDANDQPAVAKLPGAVTLRDIRKRDWNAVRIVAIGNRFQFFLNDKPSAEFVEHLPTAKRLTAGMIQLQLHDPGMSVEFRDVKIRIMK